MNIWKENSFLSLLCNAQWQSQEAISEVWSEKDIATECLSEPVHYLQGSLLPPSLAFLYLQEWGLYHYRRDSADYSLWPMPLLQRHLESCVASSIRMLPPTFLINRRRYSIWSRDTRPFHIFSFQFRQISTKAKWLRNNPAIIMLQLSIKKASHDSHLTYLIL